MDARAGSRAGFHAYAFEDAGAGVEGAFCAGELSALCEEGFVVVGAVSRS